MQRLLEALATPVEGLSSIEAAETRPALDVLAYFLPGVAVGICNVLVQAGGGRSATAAAAPASSGASIVAAVQALVALLVACIGDAAVGPLLHGGQQPEGSPAIAPSSNALETALQQLHYLSQRVAAGEHAGIPQPPDTMPASFPAKPGQPLRVDRTVAWLESTAERLHQQLVSALPPLLMHQRPTVRTTLVQGRRRLAMSAVKDHDAADRLQANFLLMLVRRVLPVVGPLWPGTSAAHSGSPLTFAALFGSGWLGRGG